MFQNDQFIDKLRKNSCKSFTSLVPNDEKNNPYLSKGYPQLIYCKY